VQIRDAAERRRIKAIVIACAKTVQGIDAVAAGNFTATTFTTAANKHWPQFTHLLEHELDVELPIRPLDRRGFGTQDGSNETGTRRWTAGDGLELFVSEVQRMMESPARAAYVTLIVKVTDANLDAYKQLWRDYEKEKADKYASEEDKRAAVEEVHALYRDPLGKHEKQELALLAVNLGQTVGFIEAVRVPFGTIYDDLANEAEGADFVAGVSSKRDSIRIDQVFVLEYLREQGMTRRLIREVIDTCDDEGLKVAWLEASRWDKRICNIFVRCGFVYENENTLLTYRLDGQSD